MKKRLAKGRSSVVFVCLFMVVDVYGCCYCHCELLFFPTSPNSVYLHFSLFFFFPPPLTATALPSLLLTTSLPDCSGVEVVDDGSLTCELPASAGGVATPDGVEIAVSIDGQTATSPGNKPLLFTYVLMEVTAVGVVDEDQKKLYQGELKACCCCLFII